ncbi:MAG: adenylate/guanylate cyclase domain-containing protein [Thalassobaculales bacterium]
MAFRLTMFQAMAEAVPTTTTLPATSDIDLPLGEWLLQVGGRAGSTLALVGLLADRLLAEGFPLFRLTLAVRTLHPQLFGSIYVWRRGQGYVGEFAPLSGIEGSEVFRVSPLWPIMYEGAAAIRRRLDLDGAVLDYPILADLKAEGASDYLAVPIVFSGGERNFATFVADRPGGFTTRELSRIDEVLPILALLIEAQVRQQVTRQLLATYLGNGPAAQVLGGRVRRGDAEATEAVIWLTDLRGFTAMTDRQPAAEVMAALNAYLERMTFAVQHWRGDVLKFTGDGLLAIFRPEAGPGGRDMAQTAHDALAAARDAAARMAELNTQRRAAGQSLLGFGIALHLGQVMFGNIGAPARLDYTVIGPAVNLASRIEGLTKAVGRPILASAAFAAACPRLPLASLGFHALRGLAEPVELFAPDTEPKAA